MIHLYSAPTPNGLKVSLMLEECQLPYTYHIVDLLKKEQKTASFLALNPNGKIPVLVDHNLTLFESGAILFYLAEKTGLFLATDTNEKNRTMQWLFWQMAQLGPNLGGYFSAKYMVRPRVPALLEKYEAECLRVLDVLNEQLTQSPFLTENYSIADMACLPWLHSYLRIRSDWIEERPAIASWLQNCLQRPAVNKIFSMKTDPT